MKTREVTDAQAEALAEAYAKAFAAVWHDELKKGDAKEAHRLGRAAGLKALGIGKTTTREA